MQALLFELASSRASWLAARQVAVAANIANVNTAGYEAVDVKPFSDLLVGGSPASSRQTSQSSLLELPGLGGTTARNSWEVQQSGNSVSLEQELLKAGSIQQDYALSVGITRSFNRMLLAAARG